MGAAKLESALSIREASSNDGVKLREIIDLSFPFYRLFAIHSLESDKGKVLVAETEGDVIGFAKLIEFYVGGIKYGCILWIAVHPAFRHQGIACALTGDGVAALKKNGTKAVFASTQGRNAAAKTTLVRAGFRLMGFLDLWQFFGWRVFRFYRQIWFAPGEVVLMYR